MGIDLLAVHAHAAREIDQRQFDRLVRIRDDAVARGATLHPLTDQPENGNSRLFPPVIVTGAPDDSAIMTEEIFGPLASITVLDDVEEMITFFQVNGIMYYVDAYGEPLGFEDVFTKIDMCRRHYAQVGLGADYVDQFIR